MTQYASYPPGMGSGGLRPHRGVMILVFGILSLVICVFFGVAAWVMGNRDLREMDAGTMDPSGRQLTTAGKICGIVSVTLSAVGLGVWLLCMVGMCGAAAVGVSQSVAP